VCRISHVNAAANWIVQVEAPLVVRSHLYRAESACLGSPSVSDCS